MMAQADSEQALYTGLPALVVPLVLVILWAIAVGNLVILALAAAATIVWVAGAWRLTRTEISETVGNPSERETFRGR